MSLHDQSQPFVPSEFAPKPMMTLRDHIAIEAMQAYIHPEMLMTSFTNEECQIVLVDTAAFAYRMADAMRAERDK
jgi:hypothetical protein